MNVSLLKAFKMGLVEAPRLTRNGLPAGATKNAAKRAKPSDVAIAAPPAAPMDAETRRKRQARANRIITPLRAAMNYGRKTPGWRPTPPGAKP